MKIKNTTENSSATSAAKSSGFAATLLAADTSQKNGIGSYSSSNADTGSSVSFKNTLKKLSTASENIKNTQSDNEPGSSSDIGSKEQPSSSTSSTNQSVAPKQKVSNALSDVTQKLVTSGTSSANNAAFGAGSTQVKAKANTAATKAATGAAPSVAKNSKKSLSDSVNGSSVVQTVSDSAITTLIASLLKVMNAPTTATKPTVNADASSLAGVGQGQANIGQSTTSSMLAQQGMFLADTPQNMNVDPTSLVAGSAPATDVKTPISQGEKNSFQKIDSSSTKQPALVNGWTQPEGNAASAIVSGVDASQKMNQANNQDGVSLSSFSNSEIINPISITFASASASASGDSKNAPQVSSNVVAASAEVSSINLQGPQVDTGFNGILQTQLPDEGEPVLLKEDEGHVAVPLATTQNGPQLNANEDEAGEHSDSSEKQELKENLVPANSLVSAPITEKNFASLLGLQAVGQGAQTPLAQLLGMVQSQPTSGVSGPTTTQTMGDDSTLSMTIMMDNSKPVTVRMENTKGVTTSIVLESDDPEVVQHLTKNKHQLMDALGTAGLNAGAIKIDVVLPTHSSSDTTNQQGGDNGQGFASGDSAAGLLGGMSDSGNGQRGAGQAWGTGSVSGPHEVLEPNVVSANIPEAVWGRRGRGINITA